MSRRALAALAAVLVLVPAASASAATTVAAPGSQIDVQGDDAANEITVTPDGDQVIIAQLGAMVEELDEADPDCEEDAPVVRCSTADKNLLRILGAGGNDTLTLDTSVLPAEIHGGQGDDTLNSSDEIDEEVVLDGNEGNDTLNARSGRLSQVDRGGEGNDTFNGNPFARDDFIQEAGGDAYNGGTETFTGAHCLADPDACGHFEDFVRYVIGPVQVTFDGAANDGAAGEGDNVSLDIESVAGTEAADRLDATGAPLSKSLHGAGGDDVISGGNGDDGLYGEQGSDQITGGPGDDGLFSGVDDPPAANRLDGGDGNDQLEPGEGAEDLIGGPGRDSVFFVRDGPVGFDITVDDQPNDGQKGINEGDNVHSDVELIATWNGDDRIIGSANAEHLSGGFGNDEIDGGGGVDIISGFNGADTLTSRDGGFDLVDCGEGVEASVQADANDQLYACENAVLTQLPPPPDLTDPVLALGGASSVSAKAFARARGVSVNATTSEPAVLFGQAIGRGKLARAGDLVLGQRTLPLGVGKRKLRVRFSKPFVRAIKRRLRRRAYRLTVRVTATDAAGNAVVQRKRITIKRRR